MSSAIGSTSQAKPWWSRSKSKDSSSLKSKDSSSLTSKRSFSNLVEDNEKYMPSGPHRLSKPKDSAAGLKFNTLASAMGFKSKKLPALTIQDPPSITSVHRSPSHISAPSPLYTSRPAAKSISTVRSSDYDGDEASDPHTISEPRTPSDHPRDRMSYQRSVLTLSEMDPFAAGGVVIQTASQDSYRQSVFSDTSFLEPNLKRSDFVANNRSSYASSSSNSHSYLSEPQSGRLPLPRGSRSLRSPSEASKNRERRRPEPVPADRNGSAINLDLQNAPVRLKTPSGSNSSCSTVTLGDFRNRLSEPLQGGSRASHPRARGMTVAAAGLCTDDDRLLPLELHRKASDPYSFHSRLSSPSPSSSPLTFVSPSTTPPLSADSSASPSSTRPLVLVRKASSPRVQLPPPSRAPPTSDLPPPPPDPSSFVDDLSFLSDPPSPSTSSISLAPSIEFSMEDSAGDAIALMMQDVYSPIPTGSTERRGKGSGGSNRARTGTGSAMTLQSVNSVTGRLPSSSASHEEYVYPDDGMPVHHTSSRLLKRLPSQQSLLGKRYSGQSLSSSVASLGQEESAIWGGSGSSSPGSKTPRKQRSFHHSRLPLPPLPALRHANSYNNANAPPEARLPSPSSPTMADQQQRKGGFVYSPSTRKRLFSGSSIRRSTSSQGPASPSASAEDEKYSILSADDARSHSRPSSSGVQKVMISFGHPLSLLTNNSCVAPSSFWNEPVDAVSRSQIDKRASQSEYTPQHIIPPADMLKLEQQLAEEAAQRDREIEQERKPKLELQPGDFGFAFVARRQRSDSKGSRSRTDSIMSSVSAGTLAFGNNNTDDCHIFGESSANGSSSVRQSTHVRTMPIASHNGKPRELHADSARLPLRSSSVMGKALSKPPTLTARPSTAQPNISSPTSPTFSSFTASPERSPTSLPPPPRSRPSREYPPIADNHVAKRSSLLPLHALSPPPRSRRPHTATSDSRDSHSLLSSPPSSFDQQKIVKRRSIVKKPSFLDIEDELDATTENLMEMELDALTASPIMESSFLDMEHGRDSLDTDGSCHSEFYV